MEDNGFVRAEISSFLYNAGIVGLHFLLKTMEAKEGVDYRIEKNTLLVSKAFLAGRDITQDYIDAHIKKFRKDAAFTHICHEIDEIATLTERYAEGNEKIQEKLDKKYKFILDTSGLLKKSFLNRMMSLDSQEDSINLKAECQKIKKNKDYQEKQQQLNELKKKLMRPRIRELLLMESIVFSRINAIWSNKAFLNTKKYKNSLYDVFENEFIVPLKKYFQNDKKATSKRAKTCIECEVALSETFEISFLHDTMDDMKRKCSAFWNYKPDTYLCPFCAFVYVLAPLGFETLGKDLFFINANTSINNLIVLNASAESTFAIGSNNEENQKYQMVLDRIVQMVLKNKMKEQKNIQVIVRDKVNQCYKFSIIAKDILNILKVSMKNLEHLMSYEVALTPKKHLNIYQQVVLNILNRSNQYSLLNTVLRHSLRENTRTAYLMMVLKIQIKMLGGESMEQKQKKSYIKIFEDGQTLRKLICGDKATTKDADNKLRGFIYQLLNALQTQNSEKFWYLVMNMYTGFALPVPETFLKTFQSEKKLQYLGYAFILGLKNEAEEKKEEAKVNG